MTSMANTLENHDAISSRELIQVKELKEKYKLNYKPGIFTIILNIT